MQRLNQALSPLPGIENWEVIIMLCKVFGFKLCYKSPEEVLSDIRHSVKGFERVMSDASPAYFWSPDGRTVLYTEGFGFEDAKARLEK